ncbi:MAG: M28 family peptidase [Bacteroidia bacterium]|nr:M28 family peptidase [Bacteroidia bacterium]MCX7652496.1 M28 family peptidase [Bacteroidia bacterium]MDW8416681.1 M28 family peptidase [Bacteroidia bacterium]
MPQIPQLSLRASRSKRFLFSLSGLLLSTCTQPQSNPSSTSVSKPISLTIPTDRPAFSADSAYAHIQRQLSFGMRIPGTSSHKTTGDWIVATLKRYGASVHEQVGTFKGTPVRNIIGSFGPKEGKRVFLSAHWDSRPFADQDPEKPREPVPGANDGASGVAVLLELARLFSQKPLPYAVDIIFWDAEDLGREGVEDSYCLGSQYWISSPQPYPRESYVWGIHLDMVGARGAAFLQEGYSRKYAPRLVETLWQLAQQLGYGQLFPALPTEPIIDDSYYLSARGGIPVVNIIQRDPLGRSFFPEWHTTRDDMSVIHKPTLQAVGELLVAFLYATTPEQTPPQ